MAKKNMMPMQMIDNNWQADCDARTLMNAEEIKADKKRLAAASKAATKIVTEAQKTVQSAKTIAAKTRKK